MRNKDSSSTPARNSHWLVRLVIYLLPKWEIREEMMCDQKYWMIYRVSFLGSYFFERWNTPETAEIRMRELQSR